jgi:hypothetical protein
MHKTCVVILISNSTVSLHYILLFVPQMLWDSFLSVVLKNKALKENIVVMLFGLCFHVL